MMQVFLFLTLVVSYISGKNYLIINSQTGIQCQKYVKEIKQNHYLNVRSYHLMVCCHILWKFDRL